MNIVYFSKYVVELCVYESLALPSWLVLGLLLTYLLTITAIIIVIITKYEHLLWHCGSIFINIFLCKLENIL